MAEKSSYLRSLDAACSYIQVIELIQKRIPPSHFLTYCSNYLALSGIILYAPSLSYLMNYTDFSPS